MNNQFSLELGIILSPFFHMYFPRILITLPSVTHSCLVTLGIKSSTFFFYQRKMDNQHHRSSIRDYSFTCFSDNSSLLTWFPTSLRQQQSSLTLRIQVFTVKTVIIAVSDQFLISYKVRSGKSPAEVKQSSGSGKHSNSQYLSTSHFFSTTPKMSVCFNVKLKQKIENGTMQHCPNEHSQRFIPLGPQIFFYQLTELISAVLNCFLPAGSRAWYSSALFYDSQISE